MPYVGAQKREYQRKRCAAKRAAWMLVNGPCRCGATENLEVDHKDPATKVSHNVWSWSEERRAAELAKCQVLCVVCHKAKTASDARARVQHGTLSMYVVARCRCAACRQAKSLQDPRRPNAKRPRRFRDGMAE